MSRVWSGVGFAVLVASALGRVFAQQLPPQPPVELAVRAALQPTAVQQAECLAGGTARVERHRVTGAVRFLGGDPGQPLGRQVQAGRTVTPEVAAQEFLAVCGSLFGASGLESDLSVAKTRAMPDRRSVVRLQQRHQGIPVFGGELIVNLNADQTVLSVSGELLPSPLVSSTIPAVTAAVAADQAVAAAAKWHDVPVTELVRAEPELWIYSPGLVGPDTGAPRLVWRTEVTSQALRPIRELVLVDAERGSVALHFNQIDTVLSRQTYTTANTTTLPGTLVCTEADPSCAVGDAHAAGAHLSAADTYNFYQSVHGRDSINNAGLIMKSTVHYGSAYVNAFWNGSQMVYGDGAGFPLADDVVGHELTHGVTQYESNLFYYYQSGAINESFSDVWGEFVDQTNGRGNDTAGVKWLMGEDVTGLGALRNMANPPAFGDPDRMTSANYYTGTADSGGVHTNSGVNNKAVFLMVDGGTFNGQTVAALGITKVAKIYYEAQANLLTSGSDYADLTVALSQACNTLVGTAGIVVADCAEVVKATTAVEMGSQPVAGFNTEAPVCSAGQTPSNIFFDTLEAGAGAWGATTLTGTNRWSYGSPYGRYAHSGVGFLYADDFPEAVSDSAVSITTGVLLPANAFLHFAHAFGFEQGSRDGGVVEYSTNNGASWIDAGTLFDNVGYNGTIASGFGNPLAGRAAFVDSSHGYRASRANLSSLAGQSVRFRWRMGIDASVYNWGWWLDDVRIYTCASIAAPTVTSITPNSGPTTGGTSVGIAGTGFVNGATVAIGGVAATGVTFNSATSITATTGARAAGTVNVVVTNPDTQVGTLTNGFTYVVPPPGAFAKIAPINGATGVSASPTLSWGASTGATSYEYCYDQTNDNACAAWTSTAASTSVGLSGLTGLTTYYWHVRASNAGGTTYADSSATAFWNFTTQAGPPGAFGKTTPANGASGLSTTPTLSWSAAGGATGYEYCYDARNDNACGTWTSVGAATSVGLSGLAPGTSYYWHVRATNGLGTTYADGGALAFWSFGTQQQLPGAFGKTTPANGATGVSTSPTLSWSAATNGPSYEYCYDTTNDNACAVWTSVGSATSAALSGLLPSTAYSWHVRATNAAGTTFADGSGTAFWSFTTAAATGPGAFGKTAPADGATNVPTSPTLTWGASSGATSYEYCADARNDNACEAWTSAGASLSAALSNLSAGTSYFWQVRATNGGAPTPADGAATAFWRFTTAGSSLKADFNGDGLSDLLVADATGMLTVWLMDGPTPIGSAILSQSPLDPAWAVVGVRDFTGDGKPDVLVQQRTTGALMVQIMDGVTRVADQAIPVEPNTPWRVVATGDLNADGAADLVWAHPAEGRFAVWFMRPANGRAGFGGPDGVWAGEEVRDTRGLPLALGPTSLGVVGTGDIDGDGQTDLVLQDAATSEVRIWTLRGTTVVAETALVQAGPWQVRAIGDYNGDDRPDILWQRVSDGALYYWQLRGTTLTREGAVAGLIDATAVVVGPR